MDAVFAPDLELESSSSRTQGRMGLRKSSRASALTASELIDLVHIFNRINLKTPLSLPILKKGAV